MKRLALPLLAAALVAAPVAAQWQVHQVDGGRVAIHFFEESLEQAGLQLELLSTDEVGDTFAEQMSAPQAAFSIDGTSDLLFAAAHAGDFQPYGVIGGSVNALGGFILTDAASGNTAEYINFEIHPKPVQNDGPGGEPDPDYMFLTKAGHERGEDFKLCYVKVSFLPGDSTYEGAGAGEDHIEPRQLHVKAWDLIMSADVAEQLGRPELADKIIGYGKVEADVSVYEGDFVWPAGQNPWTPYGGGPFGDGTGPGGGGFGKDVALGILSSLTQNGHVGTFPNGRAGLSMSTTSCNFGDENVPWQAAMNENHPGIVMQLYRDMDGRFEQVGISWVKHGFFALSNSQCIPCQNPSGGTFLGVGCSDTYGTGNNSDPFWLGPREEWNKFTHHWTCEGSYFDGTPVDCDRDQNGSGNGSVNHRLEVNDADLNNAGATYYYEANYLVREDPYLWNNIGSRRATMNWNGFSWSFSSGGAGNPLESGPALLRWADADATVTVGLKPDDGNVVLSVNTEDLGNGKWRYEYALFNWNLERGVRSFSVPACDNPTELYFHDFDPHAQNDWEATVSGGNITWEWNDVVVNDDMVAGPLGLNHLVNFGFTSTVAPADRNAVLGMAEAGGGGDLLNAATLAPACFNLTSTPSGPAGGQGISLDVKNGTDHLLFAVLDVGGVPIPAITFPTAPLPFDGFGEFSLPISIPASVSGIDFGLVAGDVTTNPTSLIKLSNLIRVDVQD